MVVLTTEIQMPVLIKDELEIAMIKYIFVGVFFICFSEANASSMERKNLIEGCKQVVFLYENKNDQRRISQFMTSASESLLAGYCKGLVQSFVTFSSVQAYPCEYNKKR